MRYVRAALIGAAVGILVPDQPRSAIGSVLLLAAFWVNDEIGERASRRRHLSTSEGDT